MPESPQHFPSEGHDATASRSPSETEAEEIALVAKAADGDEMALSTLLERCGPQVRHRLTGKISHLWQPVLELDDVMQVTYLEAFLQIERFTPNGLGAFTSWLAQIAENNLRDAIRGLERVKRPNPRNQIRGGPAEDSYTALVEMLGVTHSTPSRQAAKGELKAIFDQLLCELPTDYEKVIRLMDLEGKSAAEVGAELDRSPGAIHMLRARAHDRLRTQMGSPSRFFSTPG